jgi:hypothetical protein
MCVVEALAEHDVWNPLHPIDEWDSQSSTWVVVDRTSTLPSREVTGPTQLVEVQSIHGRSKVILQPHTPYQFHCPPFYTFQMVTVPSDLIQLLRMDLFPRSPCTFTVCFTLSFLELVKGMIHMCSSPHMDIQTVFVSYQAQDKLPDKNHFVEVMLQYRFLIRLGVTRSLRLGVDLTPEHCPACYEYDHRVLVMDGNFKWWKQVRPILPNTTHPNLTTYH